MTILRRTNTAALRRLLVAAQARIAQGWCQNRLAEKADGSWSPPSSPETVRWCALGALFAGAAPSGKTANVAMDLLDRLSGGDVVGWQNAPERVQAEVCALYDRAIRLCQEKTP